MRIKGKRAEEKAYQSRLGQYRQQRRRRDPLLSAAHRLGAVQSRRTPSKISGGPAAGTDNGIEIRRESVDQIEGDMNERKQNSRQNITARGKKRKKEKERKKKLTE